MSSPRHKFATEPLTPLTETAEEMRIASRFEQAGNWLLAGETYELFCRTSYNKFDELTQAKLFSRAGTCFEIAGQARPSAEAYRGAALLLMRASLRPEIAAELFNRAAVQFSAVGEFLSAYSCWRWCAEQFAKINSNVVNCTDSYGPLPISALKSHLCGLCYEAAANAGLKIPGEEIFAVIAYWDAGRSYASGIPNIQAFDAYHNSLKAGLKYRGTLEADKVRKYLPLTEAERTSKLDLLYVMEAALRRCNDHHQVRPGPSRESNIATDRQMAAVFRDFWRISLEVGNPLEGRIFRSMEKERIRSIYLTERRYAQACLYWVWKITAGYGESLARWSASCAIVLLLFATLYYAFDLIKPVTSVYDYFYFSVVTFTTLGYGDIHPIGLLGKVLANLEVASGFLMFGILLSFLGNLFQRT